MSVETLPPGMRTSFGCPCGSEVTAEGEWAPNQTADLTQECPACGEGFIITFTSIGKPAAGAQADGGTRGSVTQAANSISAEPRTGPLEVGETTPDFELPGIDDDGFGTFHLSEYTRTGPVLLAFYSFDFSPVSENELGRFRDIEWAQVAKDTDVLAISGDNIYSHQAFRETHDLEFPLLSDRLASVADTFGVTYDEWKNQPVTCQPAIFGINPDHTIGYRWHSTDATEEPDDDDLEDILNWAG